MNIKNSQKRPPYENLAVYQLALVNQQLTEQFTGRWVKSLEKKHRTEGGLAERLYRERAQYRGY